jgi:uncharacterized membrane protein YidH (DUF202 family)
MFWLMLVMLILSLIAMLLAAIACVLAVLNCLNNFTNRRGMGHQNPQLYNPILMIYSTISAIFYFFLFLPGAFINFLETTFWSLLINTPCGRKHYEAR